MIEQQGKDDIHMEPVNLWGWWGCHKNGGGGGQPGKDDRYIKYSKSDRSHKDCTTCGFIVEYTVLCTMLSLQIVG